ncbi:MAG: hypothetical protein QG625_1204 [Cyanobacteriota bacterium erpe_2018_sw_39hr_WHONDRS-SW48-000098_B_bin.30]|jgi:hypothetical protein|nr:hypothetical protein [Candidatus Obscuribacter sp.]MDQ5965049.1 hypothetical protein [Cyanobacteriota bacterium erpe_2018_sw_39hr_WHONDRS-SW48-000098_B_bin.30]
MTNRAESYRDDAGAHRVEILGTADNFYAGKIGEQDAAKKIHVALLEAYQDGSAGELLARLKKTELGQADVKVETILPQFPERSEVQTLVITPGFWQSLGSERKDMSFMGKLVNAPNNLEIAEISMLAKKTEKAK